MLEEAFVLWVASYYFSPSSFCRTFGYFFFFFLTEVAEIFQSTTLESPLYFSGRGLFFGTCTEGLLTSVTKQHVSWLCQLWTYLEPFFYLQPRLWLIWEDFALSAVLMPWVTLCGDEVPVSHRWDFNQSVSSRKLPEKMGEPPKILLNIYYLKAGAKRVGATGRLGAILLNQSIIPCKSTGGLFWQW